MSLQRRICIVQRHLTAPSDYVWISEDVLNSAFQRFSHARISRRHVSLAPGPLEARKRASKRRMMNLAQAEGAPELDPCLLPGSGILPEKGWRWQSPSAISVRDSKGLWSDLEHQCLQKHLQSAEPSPIPRWLAKFNIFNEEAGSLELQEENDQTNTQKPTQTRARAGLRDNPQFLEDLKRCKDLAGLYKWAAKYNIELRRYSRLAFRQLHESGQSPETLRQSLGDDALNNTDNLDFLLRKQTSNLLIAVGVDKFEQWFQQTLALGQWSEVQISVVVKFIANISTVSSNVHVTHSLTAAVLDGLESSTVFGIKDLRHNELAVLLEAVTRKKFTRISQDLGVRIIRALGPSQSKCITRNISLFFQKAIEVQASKQEDMWGGSSKDAIPRCFEILWTLHRTTACAVVYKISKTLVTYTTCLPESNIPLLRLLDGWWSFIRHSDVVKTVDQGSNRRMFERLLIGKPLVIIATYLRHLDDSTIASYILRRMLVTDLNPADQNRASRLFEEIRQNERHNDRLSPFVSMMRAAHTYGDISERTTRQVFRLLQILQKSTSIIHIIAGLRAVNIIINERVISTTIKESLHFKHPRAENIFRLCQALPLERCPEIAENMIRNINRSPHEALDRYVSRHPWCMPGSREPPDTLNARAQLLQRMALTYSTTTRVTNRMAFRFVYKCYSNHVREHLGYVRPGMVLALVRTGIIRPLQSGQWVSTMRLRWILSLVQLVEGPDVAQRVDRAVYTWRGIVVKQIQDEHHQRKRARYGRKEGPMDFSIRHEWNRSQRTIFRVLESLDKGTSQRFVQAQRDPKWTERYGSQVRIRKYARIPRSVLYKRWERGWLQMPHVQGATFEISQN